MLHNIIHSLSSKVVHPNFKKSFYFLDLAKSSRSGQYLAGTGSEKTVEDRPEPEPDFRSHTDSTYPIYKMNTCWPLGAVLTHFRQYRPIFKTEQTTRDVIDPFGTLQTKSRVETTADSYEIIQTHLGQYRPAWASAAHM